jgi:hypothetical protein
LTTAFLGAAVPGAAVPRAVFLGTDFLTAAFLPTATFLAGAFFAAFLGVARFFEGESAESNLSVMASLSTHNERAMTGSSSFCL